MLALFIGYLSYNIAEGDAYDWLCGLGTFICMLVTLIPAISLHYETGRLGINVRVLSGLFFVLFLISNFCFAGFGVKLPYYIITNGILLTIFLVIFYKIKKITTV